MVLEGKIKETQESLLLEKGFQDKGKAKNMLLCKERWEAYDVKKYTNGEKMLEELGVWRSSYISESCRLEGISAGSMRPPSLVGLLEKLP